MTIFYPAELAQTLETGLSVTPAGSPTIVKPDRGRSFSRGGGDANPLLVDAAQRIVRAWQIARFDRFWRTELLRGSLPFWMPDQQFDGLTLMMPDTEEITMPDGIEPVEHTAWWQCQFIGRPSQPSVQSDYWRITFPLEVINKNA